MLRTLTINVPGAVAGSPFGAYDVAEGRVGGKAMVRGWAIDPDALTAKTEIHVYVDGPAGSGARGVTWGWRTSIGPTSVPHTRGPVTITASKA